MRRAVLHCLLILPVLLAGCAADLNARLELGAVSRTPTFTFDRTPPTTPPLRPRDQWQTTVIVVPIDAVAHNPAPRPIYTYPPTERPRVYGLYPNVNTSLRAQSTPWIVSLLQSLDETADSLLVLFDPWFYDPNRVYWSPREIWKRSPPSRTWSSGRTITPDEPNP